MQGDRTAHQSQRTVYIRHFHHITPRRIYLIQALFCCQELAERPPPELNSHMLGLSLSCL